MPALLTTMSSWPNSFTVAATASAQAASLLTSWAMNTLRGPSSAASARPSSASTSVMATLAPSASSRRTIAAPMPRAPPVTSAVLPWRGVFMVRS